MKSLFSLMLAVFLLSACADSVEVRPPADTAGAKSNLKTKSTGPQIERALYTNNNVPTIPNLDDEDEAVAAVLKTAQRMLETNDTVSANMLYQRALSTNPNSIAALMGLARVAELRKEPHAALQAYREIIRLDGENEAAHRGVAKNLMALGLYDKAVDQLNKLRAIKGDDPETLNMMGMAYTRADTMPDHFDKAVEAFNTSLGIDPDRMTTKNNLGFTYILAGRLPEAIELLEKLVDDPRATVQHRQNLALAYGLAGREQDARSIAMQDLPKVAVEKNIQSYRAMREKNLKLMQGTPVKKEKKHKAPATKPTDSNQTPE